MLVKVTAGRALGKIAGILGAIAAVGCGAAGDSTAGEGEADSPATQTSRTLSLGMAGDDVVTLNNALASRGYFPNARLQEKYPSWRPIIAEEPGFLDVFDESTQQALLAFQHNSGLPVTGEADDATLNLLAGLHCGVPDGIPPMDPSNKFNAAGTWGKSLIKWKVYNTDTADLTMSETTNAMAHAFGRWGNETNLAFESVTSGEDIAIAFLSFTTEGTFWIGDIPIQIVADQLNWAEAHPGGLLLFNTDIAWQFGAGNNLDLLATHEIGHGLGLGHSSIVGAAMQHSVPTSTLTHDDRVGISVLYDKWERVDGSSSFVADDIAVIPFGNGPLWARSTAGKVHRQVGNNWTEVPLPNNKTANRITVDSNGNAWAVTPAGEVFCRTAADGGGTWRQQRAPVCMSNIAAGRDRQLWAAACDSQRIFKWTPTNLCAYTGTTPWQEVNPLPGKQWHLAAGTNAVWAIDTNFNVYRRSSTSGTAGTPWVKMPYPGAFGAFDIAVDSEGQAWATDLWDFGIWAFNSQPCQKADGTPCAAGVTTPPDDGAVALNGWKRMLSGNAFALTAGGPQQLTALSQPRNGPIVIDPNNKIFRTTR